MNILKTPKATISRINNNTVKITIHEQTELTESDIYSINDSQNALMENTNCFVLFVPPEFGTITAEGINASATPEVNLRAIAKAILIKNLSRRLVAGFFIRIKKPACQTRTFPSEAAALEWFAQLHTN